jgi:hypothetical protein
LEEDKKKYKNGEYTPSNVKNFYPWLNIFIN